METFSSDGIEQAYHLAQNPEKVYGVVHKWRHTQRGGRRFIY